MRLSKFAASLNCDTLFLHAPGRDLIEEGIDRLSRDVALFLRGPSCNASLRLLISNTAVSLHWILSVDLFATSTNTLTPRLIQGFSLCFLNLCLNLKMLLVRIPGVSLFAGFALIVINCIVKHILRFPRFLLSIASYTKPNLTKSALLSSFLSL